MPRVNPALGGKLSPDIDEAAQAIARKQRQAIVPEGAWAANLLGLSTQVPSKIIHLTDGPNSEALIGRRSIHIKHARPKAIAGLEGKFALVVQALRHLGRESVGPREIETLRAALSPEEKRHLVKDTRFGVDWIYEVAKRIAEDGVNKVAQMAARERADLFSETANRKGLPEALIEKDFRVCWVLKQLFSIKAFEGRLLFKGGRSLSKIFHAINRFSEDIDLAVDCAALGFTGERDPRQVNISKTKRNTILSEMMTECQRYIGSEFLDELRARCREILRTTDIWRLDVSKEDPNTVQFHYPASSTKGLAYVAQSLRAPLSPILSFSYRLLSVAFGLDARSVTNV